MAQKDLACDEAVVIGRLGACLDVGHTLKLGTRSFARIVTAAMGGAGRRGRPSPAAPAARAAACCLACLAACAAGLSAREAAAKREAREAVARGAPGALVRLLPCSGEPPPG